MTPYYDHAGITIYHGDCSEWHGMADAIVSDPPYSMGWDNRVSIGRNGQGKTGTRASRFGETIIGDNHPFDPSPWLDYDQAILWGSNHFGQRLPIGTTLVLIKRYEQAFGSYLSDAEVAWMKGGHGVYCFRDTGYKSDDDRFHTTQKPITLMLWCVNKTTGTILDPFMGSGTTLRAAKDLGRKAIGIEIEERYCEIAAKRMAQEVFSFT